MRAEGSLEDAVGELGEIRVELEFVEAVEADTPAAVGEQHVVSGRVTRCTRPAAAVRVVAFLELTIGIETEFKPCLKTTTTRQLGSTTTGTDGSFRISYQAPPDPVDFCAYSARVWVEVYEGAARVARSLPRLEQAAVRFDVEVFPGCTTESAIIVVFDGSRQGQRVPRAQVFVNGHLVGTTDAQGALVVSSLTSGDLLAARLLVNEHPTERGSHDVDSGHGWSHRTYVTSVRVHHDSNGDLVELGQHQVFDPAVTQELLLSTRNALVGFNLLVSIEWDATAEEIRRFTDRLREMSELLFNATDGQFLVERLTVLDNGRGWDDADIRIYANLNQHSQSDVGALFSSDGHIYMNPEDSHEPAVPLHELGHFAFNVRDEYKAGDDWEESDGPHVCTPASLGSGVFGADGTKDACLMRGARSAELRKICSSHPSNPHVTFTAQGARNCWSVILERYGDPRWRLLDPPGRGAIPDVLPDSGVALGTSSDRPPNVPATASYIPLREWKPRWHTSSINRAGECPDRLVRVLLGGAPCDNAKVWLESASRTMYQGVTSPCHLAYGETNGVGEIRVRGAHVGDRVTALYSIASGFAEITDCGPEAVVVMLQHFQWPFAAASPHLEPVAPGELHLNLEVAADRGPGAQALVAVDGGTPISIAVARARDPNDGTVRGLLRGLPSAGQLTIKLNALDSNGAEITIPIEASFASTIEEDELTLRSADGALELALPPSALPAPLQLLIETEAVTQTPPPHGWRRIGEAYRISSSLGDQLARPAWISIELALDAAGRPRNGQNVHGPTIVRLNDNGKEWEPIKNQTRGHRHVQGRVDHLGTVALMDPPARP